MKLQNLFENISNDDEIWNYLYANEILSGPPARISRFRSFEQTSKSKYKALDFFNNMADSEKHWFRKNTEIVNYIIKNGVVVDVDGGVSTICIYILDEYGPPPFKLPDQMYTVSIFDQADSLKTFPVWFPSNVDRCQISRTGIKSLKGIENVIKICDELNLTNNHNLKSHFLGLLKIKGLTYVELDDKVLQEIIQKYLPLGDIIDCQSDLIDAGYMEFAKL